MKIEIDGVGPADLKREVRKTLSACVFPDKRILINVPVSADEDYIARFIQRRKPWIRKQLRFFAQFKVPADKNYQSGSNMLYLGRQYQVIIRTGEPEHKVSVQCNRIVVALSAPKDSAAIRRLINRWLARRCHEVFTERLKICVKQFEGLSEPILSVRKLNKRWGSYFKRHEIILNPALIQAPKSAIDYVVLHELCHARFSHHTADFYDLLESKIPDWRKTKQKLEILLLGR